MKNLLFFSSSALVALALASTDGPVPGQLAANSERMAPMVLNGYSRYPRNIGKAAVYDLDGHSVGSVQKLNADPSGKPSGIGIWLPSGRTVDVGASNVGYDEQVNVVTVGLTDAELGLAQRPPIKRQ